MAHGQPQREQLLGVGGAAADDVPGAQGEDAAAAVPVAAPVPDLGDEAAETNEASSSRASGNEN